MNLDDKISRSIDEKLGEVVQLFNDVDDATDFSVFSRRLKEIMPLLQDIKTEVKDIQDRVRRQGYPKEEDKKNKPNKQTDPNEYSPSDPAIEDAKKELPKLLEDMKKFIEGAGGDPTNLPEIPEVVERIPGFQQISDVYMLYKLIKQGQEAHKRDMDLWHKLKSGEIDFKTYVQNRLDATKEDLKQIIETLSDSIVDDVNDKINDMSDQMSTCCHNMDNKISQVLDADSPALNFTRLGKLDKIEAGIINLRGLL